MLTYESSFCLTGENQGQGEVKRKRITVSPLVGPVKVSPGGVRTWNVSDYVRWTDCTC